jgi:hypothetical protein
MHVEGATSDGSPFHEAQRLLRGEEALGDRFVYLGDMVSVTMTEAGVDGTEWMLPGVEKDVDRDDWDGSDGLIRVIVHGLLRFCS